MPENTIYQLLGNVEKDIRQSYSGGAVDVYKPHNIKPGRPILSKNISGKYIVLYYYDVNSLYPYIMANTIMPVGKPIAFDGDIRQEEPQAYGFFKCYIECPDNLEHPIIQRRVKTKSGMRTVAGVGTWTGWLCSTEMDNAVKYGYKFEIIKGYQFESGNIFKEYIEELYKFRMEYPKTHPMNYIAKLLMNSLYGKFGMRMDNTEIKIFNVSDPIGQESFNDMFELWAESIRDLVEFDYGKIKYKILVINSIFAYKYDEKEELFHGMDVNIALASAITAGARVHMSYFKNNPNFKLYYSDTDSIFIDCLLPAELVGNKLGQMKLKCIVNKAVFLAPTKVSNMISPPISPSCFTLLYAKEKLLVSLIEVHS
jgi:DNA polymerase type B, organellar and viral